VDCVGAPAGEIEVFLVPADFNPLKKGIVVYQTRTNAAGEYELAILDAGRYLAYGRFGLFRCPIISLAGPGRM